MKVKHKQLAANGDRVKHFEKLSQPKILNFKILIACVYIPIILLLCIVSATSSLTDIPVGVFCRDTVAVLTEQKITSLFGLKINPFVGIISNIGILLWCASASIYLFAFLLKYVVNKQKHNNKSWCLLFLSLFSLLLLFDDLFLFHEVIAPRFLIPEETIYACYVAIMLYLLIKFKNIFLNTEIVLLCLTLLFFFLSITIDLFVSSILLEDGLKLLGIASWASYSVVLSLEFARNLSNKNSNY